MTTQTIISRLKKPAMWSVGASLLALPFIMPAQAQADDLRISLNFGTPVAYHQPIVKKVVYRNPPIKKVVVKHKHPRVVYVNKHRGHGHAYGHNKHRWHNPHHRGRDVAYVRYY